jgi:poly(A) polymerase
MIASTSKFPPRIRPRWLANPNLQTVFAIVRNAGGEARVAGGAVRNAILKQPVSDIDLATTLAPGLVAESFRAQGHLVIPTGIDHGTVTVKIGSDLFEITTLRTDVETDGRHAIVAFTSDWAADASRRDFTINAMFLDSNGKIYDFTKGYQDLQNRRVRFVGSPSKRIEEDYLRILRFFRFYARYAKGKPDAAALSACVKLKAGLATLSAERIRTEVLKLLEAPRAVDAVKLMASKNILSLLLPGNQNHTAETWRVMKRLPPVADLRLSLLSSEPAALKERLRLSNALTTRLSNILDAPNLTPNLRSDEQRRILYELGEGTWRDAVQLSWARSRTSLANSKWKRLLSLPNRWSRPAFPISGKDLVARGIAPGPQMGQILSDLEDWWVATNFNATRDDLLSRL